ncbi:natural killer cell receptor 2B4 isoform X4 [Gallus gallus]|uniref:natural killer cell receptor 2B4 isoform X4 n=1 Tax=Gallus gallus TaxID=9031 RepID=UPI001AE6A156|nr:natural killer cell receptor 2B4 isoform X4 [Gallus gallus]
MQQHGGALHALEMLLCLVLGAAGSGQGTEECRNRTVLTGSDLHLLLEEPLPLDWAAVDWKVTLGAQARQRILTVRKDRVDPANSTLSQRATFHWEPLSLQIRAVTQADSGIYYAEIATSTGSVWTKCFLVSVWEPVVSPRLETLVLQEEQGWCHLQLSCTVPGATAVSYSWSRDSDPLGNQSVLLVSEYVQPVLYVCNVSNPASWSTASIDMATACTQKGLFGAVPWWAVTVLLVLAVCIAGSISFWCWRRRGKDYPAEHTEPPLTVYEEVGRVRTGQEPNRNSEAHAVGNTIYAMVHPKEQKPKSPQNPESCTIYSTVQHRMKQPPPLSPDPRSALQSPSFRRKKLDPALVSTAYMEVTGTGQRADEPCTSPLQVPCFLVTEFG